MLTITGIIRYSAQGQERRLTARQRYQAAGLCLQCGGPRPCETCSKRSHGEGDGNAVQ